MAIKIQDKLYINAYQAKDILAQHTGRGGLFIDIDRIADYKIYFTDYARPRLKKLRSLIGDANFNVQSSKEVTELLVDGLNISEHLLMKDGKLSSSHKVLTPLLSNDTISDDRKEIIELIRDSKRALWVTSYVDQYTKGPMLVTEDYKGSKMALARPEWRVLATGRIAALYPSLQNLPREIADIITYPPGYTLVYSDSGQIEPRIQYSAYLKDKVIKRLIEVQEDAYFGQLLFLLADIEVLKEWYQDVDKIKYVEPDDEMINARKELKTILLAGSYGSSLPNVDPLLQSRFNERIKNHKLQLQRESNIKRYVKEGGDFFETAFGTKVIPEETQKYKRGTVGWESHLVRCGLNNPMQGTAADLMNQSVYFVDKLFKERTDNTCFIGYYKHDEGAFYIRDDHKDLIDEMQNYLSYEVIMDGEKWIPIGADLHIGQKKGLEEAPRY